jgi:hypothetical protein
LKDKSNWIAEYLKIKKVLSKALKNVDLHKSRFVNIKASNYVYFINKRFVDVRDIPNKEFYMIFVNCKFQRPKMEYVWCREFKLERFHVNWQDIYKTKVKNMPFQKIREFIYKLINNIVISGKLVSIWNKEVAVNCEICNKINDVKHMLFECERIQSVWHMLSKAMKCEVSWKHIVIGVRGISQVCSSYNIIIAITAYTIYAEWVKCINNRKPFKEINLFKCCKSNLLFNSYCLEYTAYKSLAFIIRDVITRFN